MKDGAGEVLVSVTPPESGWWISHCYTYAHVCKSHTIYGLWRSEVNTTQSVGVPTTRCHRNNSVTVSEQKAALLTCLILLKSSCSKESFRGCEETRVFCWISWSVEGRVPAAQSSCVVTLNVYPNWLRLSPQANAMNIESYAMFLHENQTIPLAVVMPAESHTLWPQRFFCSVVTPDLIQQREPVAKVWRSRSSTTHSFSSCSKPGVWLTRMAPFWVLLL